jgi:exonuclease III
MSENNNKFYVDNNFSSNFINNVETNENIFLKDKTSNLNNKIIYNKQNETSIFYLNFLTLNIRGINQIEKALFLQDYLIFHEIKICFLQETHIDSYDKAKELKRIFKDFYFFYSINEKKTRGVAILIKKDIEKIEIIEKKTDTESRILNVEIEIQKHRLNLINIYGPNSEDEHFDFLNEVYDFIGNKKNLILGGDFNGVTKPSDRIGITSNNKVLKRFEKDWLTLFQSLNLREVEYLNKLNKEEKMTWTNGSQSSKIDRFYIDRTLEVDFKYEKINNFILSDHRAIHAICKIKNDVIKKNKNNRWKLNEKILDDEETDNGLKIIFDSIENLKKYHGNIWYDKFIEKIRIFLQIRSRIVNKKEKLKENDIYVRIENNQKIENKLEREIEKDKLIKKLKNFMKRKEEL